MWSELLTEMPSKTRYPGQRTHWQTLEAALASTAAAARGLNNLAGDLRILVERVHRAQTVVAVGDNQFVRSRIPRQQALDSLRFTFRVGQFIISVYSNNPLQDRLAAAQLARAL